MSVGTPPEKNKIFTEEAADAARAGLKEWHAQQESQRDVERPGCDQATEDEGGHAETHPEEPREIDV
jgi:hypothetical protein